MGLFKLIQKIIKSNFTKLNFPYKIIFAITYKCNSKCKTCNIWKKSSKNELETEEIKQFFKKNKFSWINLTGGEVFLRKDLLEIVKSMEDIYLLNITTNGILTQKIIEESKKINDIVPKFILTVSIDGPKKIHNYIRGNKCWDKAVETFKKARQNKIKCFIGYTISPHNVDHIIKTVEEIKRAIPNFSIKDMHFNFYHESELYYNNITQTKVDSDYLKKLEEKIDYLIRSKKGFGIIPHIERKYLRLYKRYLVERKTPLPCTALSSSCFLDPTGDVYPCTFLNIKLGNIRKEDYNIKKILTNEKIKEIKKEISENNCPGCWTPCESYQSILGNLIK